MTKTFVSDLSDNSAVHTVFLVTNKSVRETKTGAPYLNITLSDRTGTIEARAWDNALDLDARFQVDDFISIKGRVSSFRDQLQITLNDLTIVPDQNVELSDYLPSSRWESEALLQQLRDLLNTELKSTELRRFFDVLFADKQRTRLFTSAPAAVTNHHNYVGGLIEHTLSMARVGLGLCEHYRRYYPGLINPDLVLAGCVVHDFGKCWELNYARSFSYSTPGKLLGHIVQGVELINEIAASTTPAFHDDMLTQLKHLVLSHHGHLEYGSPVLPRTPEAMLLHEIDMIDSRMAMSWNIRNQAAQNGRTDAEWSDYSRLFDGAVYLGSPKSAEWAAREEISIDSLTGPGVTSHDKPTAPVLVPVTTPAPATQETQPAPKPQPKPAPEVECPNLNLFGD